MTGPCLRPECGGATHTDGWGNPTRCPHEQAEPKHLTREELDPVVAAVWRREAAAAAGASLILPPLPHCPACKQSPTELLARDDQPITDRTLMLFRPCGHRFAANNEDVYEAALTARLQIECPLPDIDHTSKENQA